MSELDEFGWSPQEPQPTTQDYNRWCADDGHPYVGDDGDSSEGIVGRCYCGAQMYPAGGAAT